MPYVDEVAKRRLWWADTLPSRNEDEHPRVAGELNYLITELVINYLVNHGLSYQTCNDIVGALDNAKDEFKRRIQDPYEDLKIALNGDVYGPALALLDEAVSGAYPDLRGNGSAAAAPAHHPV